MCVGQGFAQASLGFPEPSRLVDGFAFFPARGVQTAFPQGCDCQGISGVVGVWRTLGFWMQSVRFGHS